MLGAGRGRVRGRGGLRAEAEQVGQVPVQDLLLAPERRLEDGRDQEVQGLGRGRPVRAVLRVGHRGRGREHRHTPGGGALGGAGGRVCRPRDIQGRPEARTFTTSEFRTGFFLGYAYLLLV